MAARSIASKPATTVAHVWKFVNGTHFYCQCNGMGYTIKVLGTVVGVEEDKFVGSLFNKFDSYTEYDSLQAAQNNIAAIVALEGDHG